MKRQIRESFNRIIFALFMSTVEILLPNSPSRDPDDASLGMYDYFRGWRDKFLIHNIANRGVNGYFKISLFFIIIL